jgi:hypothetical protein
VKNTVVACGDEYKSRMIESDVSRILSIDAQGEESENSVCNEDSHTLIVNRPQVLAEVTQVKLSSTGQNQLINLFIGLVVVLSTTALFKKSIAL